MTSCRQLRGWSAGELRVPVESLAHQPSGVLSRLATGLREVPVRVTQQADESLPLGGVAVRAVVRVHERSIALRR